MVLRSQSVIGYGLLFQKGDSGSPETFTTIVEVIEFTPNELEADDVEVTTYTAPATMLEYIAGMIEGGEATVKCNWIPDDPTQDENTGLLGDLLGRGRRNYRFILPDAGSTSVTIYAYVKTSSPDTPLKEGMTIEFTIKVAGGPIVIA